MENPHAFSLNRPLLYTAGALLLALTAAGLFIPLMDNDAGEYALIALNMYNTGDYVNIVRKGQDYLDKPHILFWLSAFSYHLFGVTAFAYKLPSVLFALAGVYATGRLASLLYGRETGWLAALVLGFSQAYMLSNHDVRTDAILTGAVALSLFHLVRFDLSRRYGSLVLACLFLAVAVGTKGMIAVVVTGMFLFFYLLFRGRLLSLLHWSWLSALPWFFLFLSPVLYCYYLQFDAHPEKITNGVKGMSGIRFILWTQNFDRLNATIKENPQFDFFFHTFLWAFLPWSLLAYYGMLRDWVVAVRKKFRVREFDFSFSATCLCMLLLMSTSKFKLPHYLNILFPLFAVVTAKTVADLYKSGRTRVMGGLFYVIAMVYLALTALLLGSAFPLKGLTAWLLVALSLAALLFAFSRADRQPLKPLLMVVLATGLSNLLLNLYFFPAVIAYQGGRPMAEWTKKNGIKAGQVQTFVNDRPFSFDFYMKKEIAEWKPGQAAISPEYLLTDTRGWQELKNQQQPYRPVHVEPDYRVSVLTGEFLHPRTRPQVLDSLILLRKF